MSNTSRNLTVNLSLNASGYNAASKQAAALTDWRGVAPRTPPTLLAHCDAELQTLVVRQ